MSNKVGRNPSGAAAGLKLTRPFICEVPAPVGGGPVTLTRADILANITGATFTGTGLSASDPATTCVSEYDIALVGLGDESDGGFTTTTCQAVVTDAGTGKTKDLEPDGNYAMAVAPGIDAPNFSMELAEGSAVVICGNVTACLDKAGKLVEKPVVEPVDRPRIEVDKIADTSALSNPPAVGDVISYNFTVRNTGNVPLNNVTVTDDNATMSGGPIAVLAVGATDTTTFTATHSVTQADLDAMQVVNQATTNATTDDGVAVTDTSDDPADSTTSGAAGSDPTVVPLAGTASMSLTKVADVSAVSAPPVVGDTITYNMVVTNDGNVDLSGVDVTDLMGTVTGGVVDLAVGATAPFTMVYQITAEDIAAGGIDNQAEASGTSPEGATVTALSVDPTESAGEGLPETFVPLLPVEKICYESGCSFVAGSGSGQYIQRSGTGVSNPDNENDPAAPGGAYFNQTDSTGVPSFEPSQALAVTALGGGNPDGHFNDPSSGTTNDWHESRSYLAIPGSECFDGNPSEIKIRGHNWGDGHYSLFGTSGWNASDLSEIARTSEDSFVANGSLPMQPSSAHWTAGVGDGTLTLPLSGAITPAMVHANIVDERQQADIYFEYSTDGGANWVTVPSNWFYASEADAATASVDADVYCCEGGTCTSEGLADTTEAALIASGATVVECPDPVG